MRAVQRVMDAFTRNGRGITSIETPVGVIEIDPRHPPERVLAYCFFNVLANYKNSPLGRRIIGQNWNGKAFIDVGANLGIYSLLARSAGAKVFMVEPEPAHAAFLLRNEKLLGPVFPVALSDHPGQLPLFYSRMNSGATSLVQSEGYTESDTSVPVTTFADMNFGNPSDISLVKIDVEGNEVSTVRGMRPFLELGHRPDIWCEVRGGVASRSRNSYLEVIEILKPFGYHHHPVSPSVENFKELAVFDLLFDTHDRHKNGAA